MAKKTISNTFTVNTVEDGDDSVVYKIDFGNSVFSYDPNTNRNTIFINGTVYKVVGNDTLVFTQLASSMLSLAFYDANGALVRNVSSADVGVENGTFITRSGNASTPSSPNAEESLLATITIDGVQVARNGLQIFKDGKSAPFYNEEWYAWSNVASTANTTTSPFTEPYSGWQRYIPEQGSMAYLWKKIVRWNYNTSTKAYIDSSPQYFRMSGTNGTSINTKGTIKVAITASGTFPTSGFSNGDLGVKQGDSYMWQFNGSSWSHVSSASSDGDSYTMTKDCTIDLDGDGTSENIKGHLLQWSIEASKWIDLGQFKGESGVTYYSHIVWATYVKVSALGLVQRIDGYLAEKDSNDTTHNWMGTYIDENPADPISGDDPLLLDYTWTNIRGDDAVVYKIKTSVESVKIPSDQTTTSKSITISFTSQTGTEAEQAFSTYYSIYYRDSMNAYTLIYPSYKKKDESLSYSFSNISNTKTNIVIFVWGANNSSAYIGQYPEGQNYLVKKEIPILKDGDTGGIGQIGRFPYYCNDFDSTNNTQTFVINSVQAPYFRYVNPNTGAESYHVFNPTTDVVESPTMAEMWEECGGNINNAPFEPMTNDFNYLITKALFANFARLATFVMNGNLMFSLRGRWRSTDNKDGNDLINLPYYYLYEGNLRQQSQNAPVYSFINENSPETYYSEIFKELSGTYNLDEVNIETGIELLAGTTYMFEKSSNSNCDIVLRYGSSEIDAPFGTLFTVREDITLNLVAQRKNSSQTMGYTNVALYAYNFSPNIAINGLTGKVVMSNAVSRGTFEGNGVFENVRTGNIRVGGGTGTIVSFFENQEMVFSKANGTEISGTFSIDANGFFKFNAI